MQTAVDLCSYILLSVGLFNLEIDILQFGELKNSISLIIFPPSLFSSPESQLYMCSLSGRFSQVSDFLFSLSLLSVFFGLLYRTFRQLLFLLPTFHSKNFYFPSIPPLLLPSYSFLFLLLGSTDFLVSQRRVFFVCFLHFLFFASLFCPSCFLGELLVFLRIIQIEISLDVFHLFSSEMVVSWLEVLNMRVEHVNFGLSVTVI